MAATAPAFRRVGAAALLVVLSGCAGVSPPTAAPGLLAVGETLHLVNGQFVTVSALMNQLYDGKIITTAQYAPWRAFAPRYQQLYPLAVEGWIAAKRTCIPPPPAVPDPAACTVQSATSTAQATALATELATLAAEAYKAIAGWGSAGAPAAAVPVQVAPQVQVQPPPPALAPPPAPPPTPPRRVAPENPDVPDFGRVIDWLMSEYEKPEK